MLSCKLIVVTPEERRSNRGFSSQSNLCDMSRRIFLPQCGSRQHSFTVQNRVAALSFSDRDNRPSEYFEIVNGDFHNFFAWSHSHAAVTRQPRCSNCTPVQADLINSSPSSKPQIIIRQTKRSERWLTSTVRRYCMHRNTGQNRGVTNEHMPLGMQASLWSE